MKKTKFVSVLTACAMLSGMAAFVPAVSENAVLTANAVEVPALFTEINRKIGDFGTLTCEKYADHIVLTKFTLGTYSHMPDVLEIPSEIDGLPVTVIGREVFRHDYTVKTIVIPDTVTLIEDYAFSDMTDIESIVIPDSVTFIDNSAFMDCTALTNVTIPENTVLDGWVFKGTPWLEAKIAEDPLVVVNGVLIDGSACEGDVVIPDTVHTIAANVFSNNEKVETVTIPDSVKKIGDYAFAETSISSIAIPDKVTEIGYYAFYKCSNLIDVTIPPSVDKIDENAFKNTEFLAKKRRENPLVIINNVLVDGKACTGDVVIPDGVTYISALAFSDVDSLTSVVVPEGVTELETHVFHHCDNLVSVTLPDSLELIGSYAFGSCGSLASINIPDSVSVIEECAFYSCKSLEDFHFPKSLQYIGYAAFQYSAISSVVLPEGDCFIGENAFRNAPKLTEVYLPDSLKCVSKYAFKGCTALTSLNLPANMQDYGEYVFSDCTSLTNVVIADGAESIPHGTFDGCIGLTEVTIPESIKKIEGSGFGECAALTDVYFAGSELDWSRIEIDYHNEPLAKATIHYGKEMTISLANINGDESIDATDAALLLSAAAAAGAGGDSGLTVEQIAAADLDGNGSFDASDASLILMYAAYSGAGGELDITEFLAQL